MESLELEGTFRSHLDQYACTEQGHLQLDQGLRACTSQVLKVSRDGASTTSLGNLFQCLTTLTVKNFFLTSSPSTNKSVTILCSAVQYLAFNAHHSHFL